jgi:hypothetical protein
LSAGSYAFTATDTTSAGTSAASNSFDVTVTSSSSPPPAARFAENPGNNDEWILSDGQWAGSAGPGSAPSGYNVAGTPRLDALVHSTSSMPSPLKSPVPTSGGQSSNFTGTVSGFGAQDVIDLPGFAFDAPTTLGYLADSNQPGGTLSLADGAQSAKIARLGNYMASSFAVASDNHGGTMVTEASQASNQSFLTNPQHT